MRRDRFGPALVIVAVSAFMITMDNTVVNIVKNTIGEQLHTPDSTLEWIVTGYILVFSCLMIPGGRLVDMYGQRIVFSAGMAVFIGASLLAGFSSSIAMLIAARLLQGVGAAIALPATLVVVTVGRTDRQKSLGMIVWIGVSSTASALGPGIGAVIKNIWGWQGVFFVNVVPGLLVIPLALAVLDGAREDAPRGLDLPGVLTSATMLFTLTYALTEGPKLRWHDPAVVSVFLLAAIALASLAVVERWVPDPIFDISFFRNKIFSGAVVSQILMGLGFNGLLYFGVTFMQKVLLFSDTRVALVLLAPAVVIAAVTPAAFWLAARIGSRLTVGGGMAMMAAGMFLFGMLHQGDQVLDLMPGVLTVAAGMALGMPLPMYVLKSIPEERSGVAGGIMNVGREMSGALGIAVLGALILSIQEAAKRSGVSDAAESFRRGTALGLPIGATIVLAGALVALVTLPAKRAGRTGRHGGGQRATTASTHRAMAAGSARSTGYPRPIGAAISTGAAGETATGPSWPAGPAAPRLEPVTVPVSPPLWPPRLLPEPPSWRPGPADPRGPHGSQRAPGAASDPSAPSDRYDPYDPYDPVDPHGFGTGR